MGIFTITINGTDHRFEAESEMPLLWALRDIIGLTGTKYGCGIGQCGACTVHLNGEPIRSCSIPVGSANNQKITTIEGLATRESLHQVQEAWIDQLSLIHI